MQIEIASGFYESESLPLSSQRCINWRPVVPQANALNQRALFDVWGLSTLTTSGATISGINRGSTVVNGVPYFVNETKLYSMTSANVVTDHGTINGAGRVSLASNEDWLVIVVPGVTGYAFEVSTSTLTEITDIDFRVSDTVSFKDGYFIFTSTDGTAFFISNLNQPLVFDALDFGSADVRPDKIIASHVNRNELFVLGEETIELFQNVGGSGFPFQRVQGGNINKGLRAKFGIVDFDNTFVFLGGAKDELTAVWRYGQVPQKISTSAIDVAIQEYTEEEISNAFAFTYAHGGNYFAAFTFTSTRIPSRTLVYDATTSALTGRDTWHERQSGITDDKWRVNSLVTAYGKIIVADSVDGRLGLMEKDVHTEYGNVIKRQRASMPYDADRFPTVLSKMVLTMESGVGTASLDPQIVMDYSDNGGRSWANPQMRSYGKIGRYETLPTWRRMGQVPRDRVLRFTTTEAVRSNLLRLDVEISPNQRV
jgi:hypothetical protein